LSSRTADKPPRNPCLRVRRRSRLRGRPRPPHRLAAPRTQARKRDRVLQRHGKLRAQLDSRGRPTTRRHDRTPPIRRRSQPRPPRRRRARPMRQHRRRSLRWRRHPFRRRRQSPPRTRARLHRHRRAQPWATSAMRRARRRRRRAGRKNRRRGRTSFIRRRGARRRPHRADRRRPLPTRGMRDWETCFAPWAWSVAARCRSKSATHPRNARRKRVKRQRPLRAILPPPTMRALRRRPIRYH